MALGHDYVGTEHILLAMARESEGLASRVLADEFNAEPGAIRNAVLRRVPPGDRNHPVPNRPPRARDFTFEVRPDPKLLGLLMAAAGRALSDERDHFGFEDVIAVAKDLETQQTEPGTKSSKDEQSDDPEPRH